MIIKKECAHCYREFEYDPSVKGQGTRKFCSKTCRTRHNNETYYKDKDTNKRAKERTAQYEEGKLMCLMCYQKDGSKRWYKQLGSHVTQVHDMTAREYKQYYDLEVSKGLLTPELKELKAKKVFENGTVKNLDKGKSHRFKMGDPRAGKYKRSSITIKRLLKNKPKKKHDEEIQGGSN